MDIPIVMCVKTNKKTKNSREKKPSSSSGDSPKSIPSSPSTTFSPKMIPIPRSYATVIAPSPVNIPIPKQTPVQEYPPLPTRYVETTMPVYELFPAKPSIQQQYQTQQMPLREVYYSTNIPQHTSHLYYNQHPMYAKQYSAPLPPPPQQQQLYNPYPVYVQRPVQPMIPSPLPQEQSYTPYYQPPQMRQPPKQLSNSSLQLLYHHEKFWNKICTDEKVRQNVRDSYYYFPN